MAGQSRQRPDFEDSQARKRGGRKRKEILHTGRRRAKVPLLGGAGQRGQGT